MPLNRSSSGLVGASLIVINIDPDKHFIRTVGSFVVADISAIRRINSKNSKRNLDLEVAHNECNLNCNLLSNGNCTVVLNLRFLLCILILDLIKEYISARTLY